MISLLRHLEKELEQIITGSDVMETDRFDALIAISPIMDYEKSSKMEDIFTTASNILSCESDRVRERGNFREIDRTRKAEFDRLEFFFRTASYHG